MAGVDRRLWTHYGHGSALESADSLKAYFDTRFFPGSSHDDIHGARVKRGIVDVWVPSWDRFDPTGRVPVIAHAGQFEMGSTGDFRRLILDPSGRLYQGTSTVLGVVFEKMNSPSPPSSGEAASARATPVAPCGG